MQLHSKLAPCTLLSVLALAGLSRDVFAQDSGPGEGAGVPFQFQAGQPARADEINQNFAQLVADMAAIQADMQAQIDALQARVVELEDTTRFLSTSDDTINGLLGPHLIVEGANLHLRSGSGTTDDGGTPLGVGNLIVGYNEGSGGNFANRGGSHTIVVGEDHQYTSTGAIVAGFSNTVSGLSASVLGGSQSEAAGEFSTIVGGAFNRAEGESSVVSGGVSNFALAQRASISGGAQNTVSGVAASVSGGSGGSVSGFAASITGGQSGIAAGDQSVIGGGQANAVFGDRSVVSGGFNITLNDDFDWAACDLSCN